MLSALKALFESPEREDEESAERRLKLAAAALLVETARADSVQDADEEEAMRTLLRTSLELSADEVEKVFRDAAARADEATSLYEFTRVINDYYCADKKVRLIKAMWTVAYADGDLDKYEEALIRQVAELTYVPHQDYIRSKLDAAA